MTQMLGHFCPSLDYRAQSKFKFLKLSAPQFPRLFNSEQILIFLFSVLLLRYERGELRVVWEGYKGNIKTTSHKTQMFKWSHCS